MGEDFDDMDIDELLETVAMQNFYMSQNFEYTHSLLYQMANHFNIIAEAMSEQELYDHSVKLNTDLFQTYFGMSKALATELNYLDQKDDEIESMLKKQIEEGDVTARNKRRKGKSAVQPLEINNRYTQTLVTSLMQFKEKVNQLNTLVEDILALNSIIADKQSAAQSLMMDQN